MKRAFDRYNIFKEYPCENVNRFSKDERSEPRFAKKMFLCASI